MKKNSGILTFFLSIFIFGFLIFKPALSQDASLLPNAIQQFFDSNGNPLSSGKIYFYEVGTDTFKDVYNSSDANTPYTNPITLNAGGKPPGSKGIYGIGLYRQLVKDKNGNTIWDAVTAPGGGGGGTPTNVGDGNLVGTVLPWSGLTAPNQYVFTYGQELIRTSYPEFYSAITLQTNVICTSSSNTLTGIADTTQIPVGAPVELALCVPPGSTVISKTSGTVTLNNPANVSLNATARFFPYGNGNGSTTFNVPDLRDMTLVGRPNMGGTDRGLITSQYFGVNPAGLGATGGSQNHIQTISEMAMHTHDNILTDPGHTHGVPGYSDETSNAFIAAGGVSQVVLAQTMSAATGISLHNVSAGESNPFTIIQPSMTFNYIIKVTPDTSTSIATGVYSIGGMSGVISCGTGILCTGNIISFNGNVLTNGSVGSLQYRNADGSFGGSPNAIFISPNNLTLGSVGTSFLFDIIGSTSGRLRQTVPAIAGTTNIVWGKASGTPAVTSSSPLVLNTTTGNLTCPTCATTSGGGSLTASAPIVISGNNISVTGSALTKTDDTNVTLSLGGSPTSALLAPTSLTLGWTGQLAASRGGFGTDVSAKSGVPLFSTGVPTFTGTSGTGNFARVVGPSISSLTVTTSFTATNLITNSALSQVGAATIKGNPTASTANAQDFTFNSLTQTVSPGSLDWIPIFDNSTGTIKKINAGSIASSSVAGVSNLNGLTGPLTLSPGAGIAPLGIGSSTITISNDVASFSNFYAGTQYKMLDADNVFTPEVPITYAATTLITGNTFVNASITLTGNITTLNCSNFKQGQAGTISFIQDSFGSRTVAFNNGTCSNIFKFAGATYPTLTTSASALDILSYSCRSSSYCAASLSKGYNP